MRKLLMVDDHPVFRNGLRLAFEEMHEFDQIVEAGSKAEAMTALADGGFDLAIVDMGLPDGNGMDILEVKAGLPGSPRFFVLTMSADASLARRAFKVGASGFASKNISLEILKLALKLVAAGELYAEGEILRDILTTEVQYPRDRPDLKYKVGALTERERSVLDAILEGLSAKEVAVRLSISLRTAENYQSSVYAKLGVKTPVGLVKLALDAGLTILG